MTEIMTEQEFRDRADHALNDLQHRLTKAAERFEFESDFNAGALTIEFEDPPTRFVVSPNSPVRQIWVSAHLKSHKLDWDPARNAFAASGKTLTDLIGEVISQQLEEDVKL